MTEWARQRERILQELDFRLPVQVRPLLALELMRKLHKWTGIPEKRCAKILGVLAREGHPHAAQDGGVSILYGRSVTKWRWHPRPQRVAFGDQPVVDASDW